MATLITLLFQGEVEVEAGQPLPATEEREVVHSAFPMTPPRDATTRRDFRAWKVVPLTSGRVLLSSVVNGGDEDDYGRPVLRAGGCLLAPGEMTGALRDPAAIWRALEGHPIADLDAFTRAVEAMSIHSSAEAFARFSADLERDGAFHAQAAAVLCEETADLYLGDVAGALDMLRPALGLLPVARLARLHLAIGADDSDAREPILGLPGLAPESWRGGLLSGLFGRKKDDHSDAAADFETREVFGTRDDGPAALAEAIADRRPWPLGLDGLDRYRTLLECLDAGTTPFDAVPELEELRRAVQRLETLSKSLRRWR